MWSSRYTIRISKRRCRRHLEWMRSQSKYKRMIVPRSPDAQFLPREGKMARVRAYADRHDARKSLMTFIGGNAAPIGGGGIGGGGGGSGGDGINGSGGGWRQNSHSMAG